LPSNLNGVSTYVESQVAGAPNGFVIARPNSFTADITASNAEVARRSASSAPEIPLVGMSRLCCQSSSAMGRLSRYALGKRS